MAMSKVSGFKKTIRACTCIGCFVTFKNDNDTGNLFAVTNQHSIQSSRTELYVNLKNGNQKFGIHRKPKKQVNNCHRTQVNYAQLDIGLIRVHDGVQQLCCSDIVDPTGQKRQYRIFQGSVNSLYGKRVFKCHPSNASVNETCMYGRIASKKVHEEHRESLNSDARFLVTGENGDFATSGESGTMVVLDSVSDIVEIVGLIRGGFSNSLCSETGMIQCLILSDGLKMLETQYDAPIEVVTIRESTCNVPGNIICCGTKLHFDLPFDSNNVNLSEFIYLQMNIDINKEANATCIKALEEKMKINVFDNDNVDTPLFPYDRPDQSSINYLLLACRHLNKMTKPDFKKAKEYLVNASKCIAKVKDPAFKPWLLCKLKGYCDWLHLQVKDLKSEDEVKEMIKGIDQGIAYAKENKSSELIPKESLPYHNVDMARILSEFKKIDQAEVFAKEAVNLFIGIDKTDPSPESANRLILSFVLHLGLLKSLDRKRYDETVELYQELLERVVNTRNVFKNKALLVQAFKQQFRQGQHIEHFEHAPTCLQKAKIGSPCLAGHCPRPWSSSSSCQ